jgi:CubicO group peptidase (beta-lactamase class C family)
MPDSNDIAFPGAEWSTAPPEELALDPLALDSLTRWLDDRRGDRPYRLLVVRRGRLAWEANGGIAAETRRNLASAAKSVYSCVLGIAIAEGKLPSADARVIDYYPEMMDVPEGTGPKPGRYAFPKDADITFRQLISNTSGYMKPDEPPGTVFHYQTFGMNILTHALGRIYGVYDTADPAGSPGFGALIDRTIKEPIGGSWSYTTTNFGHGPEARTAIFGNYCQMQITARDMARLGLLWLANGRWGDAQVVPEDWLREATHVAPVIVAHCAPEDWAYGYGFWSNEYSLLWPELPAETFAASGAGQQLIWVCPAKELVVVQGPGIYSDMRDDDCRHVLRTVYEAARG